MASSHYLVGPKEEKLPLGILEKVVSSVETKQETGDSYSDTKSVISTGHSVGEREASTGREDIKRKLENKLVTSKNSQNCEQTRWHTLPRTHAPPTAFSVPKRNKKLVVWRRRRRKSQSEDPCYRKGRG